MSLPLSELVATSEAVRATSSRLEKRALMAALFTRLESADLALAVSFLAGEIPQGRLGVGWKAVSTALAAAAQEAPAPDTILPLFEAAAPSSPATLADVDRAFRALAGTSGAGSTKRATALLTALFQGTDRAGREFLAALLAGELRQGALRAEVRAAVASALGLDLAAVSRAEMFGGDLARVAITAREHGAEALAQFELRPMVPVAPMLAQSASTPAAAFAGLGGASGSDAVAVEPKLDGVRIQLHKLGPQIRVYTRQLREVTRNVPELVRVGRALQAESAILDGEALVLGPEARPLPFQDTMSRVGRDLEAQADRPATGAATGAATRAAARGPELTVLFFDLLYRDGESLIDRPGDERRKVLLAVAGEDRVVPQTHVDSPAALAAELERAIAAGHEGLMVKAIAAPYTAGRRGGQWRKLKPAVTLDLVVLAAEWGHGRRRGVLSNLHLGARDDADPARFWMLGKTFKGLTDEMLRAMTADFLALAVSDPDEPVVYLRPERVVEIAFDAVQRSSRYDSGLALRFARVKRFRPDKSPAEATTLAEVQAVFAGQGGQADGQSPPTAPAAKPS